MPLKLLLSVDFDEALFVVTAPTVLIATGAGLITGFGATTFGLGSGFGVAFTMTTLCAFMYVVYFSLLAVLTLNEKWAIIVVKITKTIKIIIAILLLGLKSPK